MLEIKSVTSSKLKEAVCVSLFDNSLGKGNNPSVLLPAMGKQYEKLASIALVKQQVLEKKNLNSNQI